MTWPSSVPRVRWHRQRWPASAWFARTLRRVPSLSRGGSQGQGAQVGRATENAWGISLDDATLPDSETRITDFAAFFAISFPGFLLPLVGVPAGEVAALGLGLDRAVPHL